MEHILWFRQILEVSIRLYFRQDDVTVNSIYGIPAPKGDFWQKVCGAEPTFDEQVVLMLALMPHLCPQVLDIFFANNKNFDRPYTEFGGWKGVSHGGFLPTGETAAFLLAGEDAGRRNGVVRMFDRVGRGVEPDFQG